MKYLFLDIDGVLNHEEWYINRVHNPHRAYKEWWENCFDPACVERLNKILEETGARLVVSSSWKLDSNLKYYFHILGIPIDFDITPSLTLRSVDGNTTWPNRGDEIDAFLKDHPCDGYVILDDDTDFTEDQIKNHFVHCCCDFLQAAQECHPGETGLTELKMREAINILK